MHDSGTLGCNRVTKWPRNQRSSSLLIYIASVKLPNQKMTFQNNLKSYVMTLAILAENDENNCDYSSFEIRATLERQLTSNASRKTNRNSQLLSTADAEEW